MTLLANLQEYGKEQDELIWRGIVDYVNGDNTSKDFQELVRQCFKRMGMDDTTKVLLDCSDVKSGTSIPQLEDRYRGPMRDILRWIIRPKTFTSEQTEEAVEAMKFATDASRFLVKHADSVHVQFNPRLQMDLKHQGSEIFLYRTFSKIGHVVTGICRFIRDQIDRHDLLGMPLTDVFPFGLCEREGCGRFFIVQRTGRARFCSNNCRSADGKRKKSLEEKAAYMKNWRKQRAAMSARKAERVFKARAK